MYSIKIGHDYTLPSMLSDKDCLSQSHTTDSELAYIAAPLKRSHFFFKYSQNTPRARPLGRGIWCILWIKHLVDFLPQFMQSFKQYPTILYRVITALDCICKTQYWHVINCKQYWLNDKCCSSYHGSPIWIFHYTILSSFLCCSQQPDGHTLPTHLIKD